MHQQLSLNINTIFEDVAEISLSASRSMSNSKKKKYGAYYTPAALSKHIVSVANFKGGTLGDHGAGAGILSALAALHHLFSKSNKPCHIEAYEIQEQIQAYLKQTMKALKRQAYELNKEEIFSYTVEGDFLKEATSLLSSKYGHLSSAIQNPPYFKLRANCKLNNIFYDRLGFRCPNIYIAFVILSLHGLKKGGTLTALVPRSFASGRYFRSARRYIKEIASIECITRFRKRSNLFKGDNVLQENCVINLKRSKQAKSIMISTCVDPTTPPESVTMVDADALLTNDSNMFILPADQDELSAYEKVRKYPLTLTDLDLVMSTGKVVEFRTQFLNSQNNGAMYLEGKCINTEGEEYNLQHSPRARGNALIDNAHTQNLLIPTQPCVLIKRISSNSDKRRMNCTGFYPHNATTNKIAISNSIQYISGIKKPASPKLIANLTRFLRSEEVELAIRAISGTTQISVDDISILRFPDWVLD